MSPDFFRFVPWEQPGARPVGYGVDSVVANIETMLRIETQTESLAPQAGLARRRELIREVDEQGILATPANSAINELVVEAARLSIVKEGAWVDISNNPPCVKMRG
jgi:hypothetical protein